MSEIPMYPDEMCCPCGEADHANPWQCVEYLRGRLAAARQACAARCRAMAEVVPGGKDEAWTYKAGVRFGLLIAAEDLEHGLTDDAARALVTVPSNGTDGGAK